MAELEMEVEKGIVRMRKTVEKVRSPFSIVRWLVKFF